MKSFEVIRIFCVLLLLALLAGCAGHRAFRSAEQLFAQGDYEGSVAGYGKAAAAHPDKRVYRMRLYQARSLASLRNTDQGRTLLQQGDLQGASAAFEQACLLDAGNQVAGQELQQARRKLQAAQLVQSVEASPPTHTDAQARALLRQALSLDPGHPKAAELLAGFDARNRSLLDGHEIELVSHKPITLRFKDADIREVFNILSKLSGINFIFDEDIRSQRVTVLLEDASFAQALEFLLRMNNLGKKVLNPKTIIIYPRTKEKDKKYEDHVIRTFFLSNIDGKKAVNLVRTMLQLRKVYVHEELNALVVRDNAETIRLVEQLLEVADRADSEVVFDLELIEVSHSDDLNLGPKLSSYSLGVGMGKIGTGNIVSSTLAPGGSTDNLLTGLSGLQTFFTLPTASFDFLKTMGNAEVLAHPSIRVKNREKAKVHIGTREPVVTVTFTGTSDTRSDNVQYVDVGVKLDIEPNIQLDDSVVTKLNLEVSSVSGRQTTQSGTQVLTITTTNAQTALALRNGERTIIGGLIRDDASNSRNTIPLLGQIPLIGDLFSSHSRRKAKREILLSITPHIIRKVDLPGDAALIWSGLEEELRAGQTFGSFAGEHVEAAPASASADPSPAPAVAVPRGAAAPLRTMPREASPPAFRPVQDALPAAPLPFAAPHPPVGAEPLGEPMDDARDVP